MAYLKSVDSHWDTSIDPHNTRSQTFTKQQLANIFNVVPEQIKITSHTSSGYVDKVTINQKHIQVEKSEKTIATIFVFSNSVFIKRLYFYYAWQWSWCWYESIWCSSYGFRKEKL